MTSRNDTLTAGSQKFYDENKEKMKGGAFADVKPQIVWYLQSTETDKLRQTFAAALQKSATIQDFLVRPEPATPSAAKPYPRELLTTHLQLARASWRRIGTPAYRNVTICSAKCPKHPLRHHFLTVLHV
jgi:hypothetical protein